MGKVRHLGGFGVIAPGGSSFVEIAFTTNGVVISQNEELFVEKINTEAWRKQRGLEVADVRVLGDFRDESGKLPHYRCPSHSKVFGVNCWWSTRVVDLSQ